MKIQTGLQKLSKRYFELLSGHDKQGWENFYKEVDEKYHKILQYQDESDGHPDFEAWTSLHESVCEKICEIREGEKR